MQIARNIHYARKKLRRLIDQSRAGTPLSDFEKTTAINLQREIHSLKAKLTALGKDPDVVVAVVAKSLQNKTKTRHGKYRTSGVGVYPLGGTIKNWR